jgi:CheY-like chemotaxis protein
VGEVASYRDMGDLLPRRRAPLILVVDDQASIAGLMSQLLTIRGYDVVTASSADQAEEEVRRRTPDLILSDVMMPGKCGYDFCRTMKENPATRLIPFVLITGLSDSSDKVRGIEAGADDFLNKPVLAEELIARVKSLLRLKEFTDELETADSVLCTLGLIVEGRVLLLGSHSDYNLIFLRVTLWPPWCNVFPPAVPFPQTEKAKYNGSVIIQASVSASRKLRTEN